MQIAQNKQQFNCRREVPIPMDHDPSVPGKLYHSYSIIAKKMYNFVNMRQREKKNRPKIQYLIFIFIWWKSYVSDMKFMFYEIFSSIIMNKIRTIEWNSMHVKHSENILNCAHRTPYIVQHTMDGCLEKKRNSFHIILLTHCDLGLCVTNLWFYFAFCSFWSFGCPTELVWSLCTWEKCLKHLIAFIFHLFYMLSFLYDLSHSSFLSFPYPVHFHHNRYAVHTNQKWVACSSWLMLYSIHRLTQWKWADNKGISQKIQHQQVITKSKNKFEWRSI